MKYLLKYLPICVFALVFYTVNAQDSIPKFIGDSLYREDQFYISVSYNIFSSIPNGVKPEGISAGVNFGFLRDFPLNKRRNLGVAIGLGFSYDQYGQNLLISENENGENIYTILESAIDFKYNRLSLAVIEAPIQFRWRNSTPSEYKFWRTYLDFRVGYTLWHKSSFKNNSVKIVNSNINEFEKLRLSTALSVGYSKFNLYVQYNINPFFNKDAVTEDGQQVNFNGIKLGLIFYIL